MYSTCGMGMWHGDGSFAILYMCEKISKKYRRIMAGKRKRDLERQYEKQKNNRNIIENKWEANRNLIEKLVEN